MELSSLQLVHKFAATLSNTMIHKQFKNYSEKKGFGKFGPLVKGREVSTFVRVFLQLVKNTFCTQS